MSTANFTQSKSNPNRWIVRLPGEPAFVASRCIDCLRITPLDLIGEGVCLRCRQAQAA
ncbi:hypothetical protein [Rhodococcus opacus]|uniref:hypothetical protein n=1 Tax=Rhodococcus opacus TaxID=37919 RepID=UPI002235AB04|nr:hypothetical protein [Rhodococcus opacus]UZG58005.1 hypothetical protein ONE62_12160 [Rhodococcus opacus]